MARYFAPFAILLWVVCIALPAHAQRRHRQRHHVVAPLPDSTKPVEIKPDLLTLRYKPQAGTLLYNIRTEIFQRVRTDQDDLSGLLLSQAQVAFHNVSIDYKKGLWSFDRYFTRFDVAGRELNGDSISLREGQAVNRITRLTFDMSGKQLERDVIDTIKLLNAEAQTNAYFFQPPRMLFPLPDKPVTYGSTWLDHTVDTILVRDNVNVGLTQGEFVYDVYRTYRLVALLDTFSGHLAVIVAQDSGTFHGQQSNSVTKAVLRTTGPLSGADTSYLDLASGRVLMRTTRIEIPAKVEVSTAAPFTDFLDVRSRVTLDESNAKDILKE